MSIGLVGGGPGKGRVGPVGVVVADPLGEPGPQLRSGLEGVEIDALTNWRIHMRIETMWMKPR